MKKITILSMLMIVFVSAFCQKMPIASKAPKLVVGVMVDQMRWDYLYRFQSRFGENGFKRIFKEGFSCENTMLPYAQTVTAVGHSSVYTGSVPSMTGIMGNEWYDREKKKTVYCVEDESVQIIGGSGKGEPMSPRNLFTTTITDELELATNFRSKVIGIAIKDRGSILPAGHSCDAAYWYDPNSGNFVTSTYYMKDLNPWTKSFNNRKIVDSLYGLNWKLSNPLETYVQSDLTDSGLVKDPFPRILAKYAGKNYGAISSTPWGNTLTLEFSKTAVLSESMGVDSITDFLAVSLSSPDYIGHAFGPNAVEVEDNYIKLDQQLADFLHFLDSKVGKGNYLFFLTADHAVSHAPGFANTNKIPGKAMPSNKQAEQLTIKKFGLKRLVESSANYQIYLDKKAIDSAGADFEKVKSFYIGELNKDADVLMAFDNAHINDANMPSRFREMFQNGFNYKLAGDVQVVYKSGYFFSNKLTGSTHGAVYAYDAHIPLLWMGWGVKQGISNREVYMTDIASTIAAILKIQMPSASIGKPITELIK